MSKEKRWLTDRKQYAETASVLPVIKHPEEDGPSNYNIPMCIWDMQDLLMVEKASMCQMAQNY